MPNRLECYTYLSHVLNLSPSRFALQQHLFLYEASWQKVYYHIFMQSITHDLRRSKPPQDPAEQEAHCFNVRCQEVCMLLPHRGKAVLVKIMCFTSAKASLLNPHCHCQHGRQQPNSQEHWQASRTAHMAGYPK